MIAFRFAIENREQVLRGDDSLKPENLLSVGGRGVVELLNNHLQKGRGERPKLADSLRGTVSAVLTGTAFVATIASAGIALRFFGGVDESANGDAPTAPVRQEALGIRNVKNNNNAATAKPTGTVLFRLAKEKSYAPDPSLLPTDEQLSDAAMKPIEAYLNNKNSNGGAA